MFVDTRDQWKVMEGHDRLGLQPRQLEKNWQKTLSCRYLFNDPNKESVSLNTHHNEYHIHLTNYYVINACIVCIL